MARRQSLSWAELRVGILVIASFGFLAAAIILIGGEAGFFTETYTITAYFDSASGMNRGADVHLEGVLVGSVGRVRVSDSVDPAQSVEIEMSINRDYQNLIRTDSILTIGTIGLLGDGKVDIARGYVGEVVPDGGTIQGRSGGGIRDIIEGTDDLVANMGVLSDTVGDLAGRVAEGEGTLGKLLTDSEIYDNVAATTAETTLLVREARTGGGTIGLLMSDQALYSDALAMIARMDGLIARAESGDGTMGRFLNDPALFDELAQVATAFGVFADRLERGEGTLGRLSNDDQLYTNANAAMEDISGMAASIANSEGTAGRLINDPALYNNVNTLISEFLKLVYDFRQDPERFLTINFRLVS
jgi:phospholipid/cholesterol/gamma-HCH transport system substrate-binding protein